MSRRSIRLHRRCLPELVGRKRGRGMKGGGSVWIMFDLAGNAVGYFIGRGKSQVRPVAVVGATGAGGLQTTAGDYAKARAIAADFRRAHRYAGEFPEKCSDLREYRLDGAGAGLPRFMMSVAYLPADRNGRPAVDDLFEGMMLRWVQFPGAARREIARCTAIRGGGMIPWLRRPAHEKAADQVNRSLPSLAATGANGTDQVAA